MLHSCCYCYCFLDLICDAYLTSFIILLSQLCDFDISLSLFIYFSTKYLYSSPLASFNPFLQFSHCAHVFNNLRNYSDFLLLSSIYVIR